MANLGVFSNNGGNIFQTNSLNESLPLTMFDPEQAAEMQALNRKQQIMNLLMQRGLQAPQGQMAGRYYAAPSWSQYLGNAAQVGLGALGTHMIDQKRQALEEKSRNELAQALSGYQNALQPKPVEREASGPGAPQPIMSEMRVDSNLIPNNRSLEGLLYNDQNYVNNDVNKNINDMAMQMAPGEIHSGALSHAMEKGQQYNRYPFIDRSTDSSVPVQIGTAEGRRPTGIEYVERTPEEKSQALMQLLASPNRQAQGIGKVLMQQQQHQADMALRNQQHEEMMATKREGIAENAQTRMATIQNTMTMKEMQLAQMEREGLRDEASKQRHDALMKSMNDDRMALEKWKAQLMADTKNEAKAEKKTAADAKDQLYFDTLNMKMNTMSGTVDKLLNNPEGLAGNFGVAGMFPNMPAGKAADAGADLESLKSQVAAQAMQDMRNMSQTGGAVGQVTEKEWPRLEAIIVGLNRAQSYEHVTQSLKELKQFTENIKKIAADAYDKKHPAMAPAYVPSQPQRSVKRTGTLNGKKVVEYSDGTVEYAQ